jgi:hypothetical protein
MKLGRIRLDATAYSVVARCVDCPSWRYLAGDRAEARRAGDRHERAVHPPERPTLSGQPS